MRYILPHRLETLVSLILSRITSVLNINSETKAGQTPLMIAVSFGNLDAVEWFLEKGATATCVDSNRCNTLHHAAKSGDTNIIDLIHTRLPDIKSKTNEGYTPLMATVLSGKLDAVKWFLDKGATVTGVDSKGLNILHLAAHSGNIGIISLFHTRLLDFESRFVDDYRTKAGRTPLMVAASFGKFDAVKWFLDKGASVTCVDSSRWDALHFAAQGVTLVSLIVSLLSCLTLSQEQLNVKHL